MRQVNARVFAADSLDGRFGEFSPLLVDKHEIAMGDRHRGVHRNWGQNRPCQKGGYYWQPLPGRTSMTNAKSDAIRLVGEYVTHGLSAASFIDGWPPDSYQLSDDPV